MGNGKVEVIEAKIFSDCELIYDADGIIGCLNAVVTKDGDVIIADKGVVNYPTEFLYILTKHLLENSTGIEKEKLKKIVDVFENEVLPPAE